MKNILILSKDVLRKDYLGCYGGRRPTPHIDKLASEGTLFSNYYSSAPSTAMAVSSMFTGQNPYQMGRSDYVEVEQFGAGRTMFSVFEQKGYETHVVWPAVFQDITLKYTKVFDSATNVHNLPDVSVIIPGHYETISSFNGMSATKGIDVFFKELQLIVEKATKPLFIWMHCPHVLVPRAAYGSDIDLFDELVGRIHSFFEGDIFLTGDHGHMNLEKGISCYGFHLYEPAIAIPLITPNYFEKKRIDEIVSASQLMEIVLEQKVTPKKYIYCDSQYFQQSNRKLMVRSGDFKYIYNKLDGSEELYDLNRDAQENVNLLSATVYDPDRWKDYPVEEIYYYDRWEEAQTIYEDLKREKNRIWNQGSRGLSILKDINRIRRQGVAKWARRTLRLGFHTSRVSPGRWGSKVRYGQK